MLIRALPPTSVVALTIVRDPDTSSSLLVPYFGDFGSSPTPERSSQLLKNTIKSF